MAKLSILGNPPAEILLQPGRNRIGRSPENDHPISDPSISTFHCEIELDGPNLRIKDLNSTNGTFIDSIPVQEGNVKPGQILQLGNVKLCWQSEEIPSAARPEVAPPRARIRITGTVTSQPVVSASAPAEAQNLSGGPDDCAAHPGTLASYICQKCGRPLCQACVKSRIGASVKVLGCPVCGGVCISRVDHAKAQARKNLTFFACVPSAFSYPFRGNGPFLLFGGTIFFALLNVANGVLGRFGGLSLTLLTLSIGYTFSYMQAIILSSIHGETRMPPFPDMSNYFEDIVVPFFRFVVIWAICLAPGFSTMIFVSAGLGTVLLVLGIFCLPMALLTVAVADSINGLNPFLIFSSISKIPGAYLVACGVLLSVLATETALSQMLKEFPIPVLPTIVETLVAFYGLSVEMRILGLLYYTNERKLGWFP